jgi:hypothetical protein
MIIEAQFENMDGDKHLYTTIVNCVAECCQRDVRQNGKHFVIQSIRGKATFGIPCSVWLQVGRPGNRGRGERIFPVASVSRPALGPTNPPVQCVLGVLSPGLKCSWGVTLTTHPYLVPRSRLSRSYTSSTPKRLYGSGTALGFLLFVSC